MSKRLFFYSIFALAISCIAEMAFGKDIIFLADVPPRMVAPAFRGVVMAIESAKASPYDPIVLGSYVHRFSKPESAARHTSILRPALGAGIAKVDA